MLTAIKFDEDLCFVTIKINNIIPNNLLAQKVLVF